ncbi:MAG: serine hydrolase [Gammaproteobacteria bacterium]|nr:serine hydrolase [Gammaproteobacteria bacterium]MDD9959485.1 serine hydrolase [Gammaproteobacteria bacterium]
MNKKFLSSFFALASIFWLSLATAQNGLTFVDPEEVGFSSEQLGKIESYFQGRVDRGEIAGIVTLVARDGKIAHLSAVGYQDAEQRIPMETDSLFRIYSMTKPIASTALMMLYQDGLFQLNDPLSKFIPEFANLRVLRDPNGPLDETVAMEREPTVQDVLRHTAGFSHGLGRSEYDELFVGTGIFRPETSLEEMMTALSTVPLMNQPGTAYRYSIGPDVALRLVEIISGMEADEYLEQRMFDPLGMDDTGYVVTSDNAHRLAPIHWLKDGELVAINETNGSPFGGVLVENWSVNNYTVDHDYKGGSIGLVSTAEDYWRFAQAMLNGGELDGERIIGRKTVEYMAQNHLTPQQHESFSPAMGFGLGFATIEIPAGVSYTTSKGNFYWAGAAATNFWIDPTENIVVVAMTQHMGVRGTGALRGELHSLVYGALVD